jgi:hypothetical protein
MNRRHIMRIELTASAKQKLSSLSEAKGMTQVAMMSRLVEWFSVQPPTIQAATLGQFPDEIRPDVARLILKQMVDQ